VDEKPHTYPLSKEEKVFQRKSAQIGNSSSGHKLSDPKRYSESSRCSLTGTSHRCRKCWPCIYL